MAGLPKSLLKPVPRRFDFSWIGGITRRIRGALDQEGAEEQRRVERQSEIAQYERRSVNGLHEMRSDKSAIESGIESEEEYHPPESHMEPEVEFEVELANKHDIKHDLVHGCQDEENHDVEKNSTDHDLKDESEYCLRPSDIIQPVMGQDIVEVKSADVSVDDEPGEAPREQSVQSELGKYDEFNSDVYEDFEEDFQIVEESEHGEEFDSGGAETDAQMYDREQNYDSLFSEMGFEDYEPIPTDDYEEKSFSSKWKRRVEFRDWNVGFEFGPSSKDTAILNTSASSSTPEVNAEVNAPEIKKIKAPKINAPGADAPMTTSSTPVDVPSSAPIPEDAPSGAWKLFEVGFKVAPDTPTNQIDVNMTMEDVIYEPRDSLEEEFSILSRATHRLLDNSVLFGGSPRKRKASELAVPVPTADPEQEIQHVLSTAQNLFSESSLFGGQPKRIKSSPSICKPKVEPETVRIEQENPEKSVEQPLEGSVEEQVEVSEGKPEGKPEEHGKQKRISRAASKRARISEPKPPLRRRHTRRNI